MNKIVLFACIAAVFSISHARPDVSLGYRYNQGHSSGGVGVLTAPAGISSSYIPTASGNTYYANHPSVGQIGISTFVPSPQVGSFGNYNTDSGFGGSNNYQTNANLDFGSTDSSSSNSFIGGNTAQFNSGSFSQTNSVNEQQAFIGHLQSHQAPLITKHFYLHSAPVDSDEQQVVRYINIGRPQKNYRVVFIDSPTSNSAKAKIIANVAPTEEKTAIYVLSRKNNALDVQTEVVTPAPVNNKPEVFFVKYKTADEALHAQKTIQAQYDALGGSSDLSNEGPIRVSSVIGSLGGGAHGAEQYNDQNAGGANVAVVTDSNGANSGIISDSVGHATQAVHTGSYNQAYLPPNHK